ncbi:hypothetical protein, partial [Enterococcus faecalis]|uniref:hypothetical protein n=1 Tax=Enterococcus faecalis TaxID=1351 RepID=UPI0039852017
TIFHFINLLVLLVLLYHILLISAVFVLEFLQKQAIASFPCKVRMFVERNACICPLAPIDLKAEIEKDGYDETNH